MKISLNCGRLLFALAMLGTGIQQLCISDFATMIFPPWPSKPGGYWIFSGLVSLFLIGSALAVLFRKLEREAMLLLGGLLLLLMLAGQVPFEYLVIPYSKIHLGVWVFTLKELALAGGAFALANSIERSKEKRMPVLFRMLDRLAVAGRYFFATTMILFGCAHFLYTQGTIPLVPHGLPAPSFWVYFSGAALIASGVSIVLHVADRVAAFLLGCMIFSWIFLVHLPNLFRQAPAERAAQITATLSAVAFSGTAFILSGSAKRHRKAHRENAEGRQDTTFTKKQPA